MRCSISCTKGERLRENHSPIETSYIRSLGLKLLNRSIPGQRRVPEVTICYLWDTLVFYQSRIPAQADGEKLRDI